MRADEIRLRQERQKNEKHRHRLHFSRSLLFISFYIFIYISL